MFSRLRPGQTPSAAAWNQLVDALDALTRVSGTAMGDVGVGRGAGGGVQVLDGREKGHWAKITARGTGNHYSHITAVPKGDGTFLDVPTGTDGSIWGTTTSADAREANGRADFDTSLPLYAWLWPDPTEDSPGFLFEFDGPALADQEQAVEWDAVTDAGFDIDTCEFTKVVTHFTLTLTVTAGVITLDLATS